MSSILASLRRAPSPFARTLALARTYAKKVEPVAPPRKVVIPQVPEGALSTCRTDTPLVGVNYLKDQPEVLALPDAEYPPWLWDLLKPKVLPDDGPGGKAEKVRMRKENRARIREQNFMKTQ